MSVLVKIIFLLLMFTLIWGEGIDVYISNGLEGKEDLKIHCKSKDNDLGMHLLHINQTFHWNFGTNFFGGTLFFCSFQWGNGRVLYFNAYDQKRDSQLFPVCHWYIHKDGPCRYETQYYQPPSAAIRKCYKWN